MKMQLGMVVLDVRDLEESLRFYRLAGLDFEVRPDRPVAVHRMSSGVSLLLTTGFAARQDPAWERPSGGYQQLLEFFVGDDAAVDEAWVTLTGAGFHGRAAPAQTGGPYAAMVDDPDGNVLLLSSDPAALAP